MIKNERSAMVEKFPAKGAMTNASALEHKDTKYPNKPKESTAVNKDVENYLTSFGQEFYRSESRADLQRTEEAAAFLSKKHQRLLNDNKKLAYELEEPILEKQRLEAALEKTSLEIEVIKQKITNNTNDADATMAELEKTNKLLQNKKGNLKKMN